MINVTAISENNTVVQCDFIIGSDAQGCMVVIVGESENFTTTLRKNNSENFTLAVIVTVPQQLLCYSNAEVFGYDIEFNGSIGLLAVPGVLKREIGNSLCVTNENKSSAREFSSKLICKYKER